ncbi:MAG: NAD(P)/FAD-dependent oxidoreductase [Candidatus Thermoplasmatota archaeon]|nr:NAD(P)/FAD-dependent oxidoreductase [Candidatus Thermoplasmatota archaeon]
MVVPKKVVIVGDGTAGIVAANKLRFSTSQKELTVTVVGNSYRHFYKADGVLIPFGYRNHRKSIKPTGYLLNYGVQYVNDEVVRINTHDRIVFLKSGKSIVADYIIIATGNRLAPERIPGYEGEARHFFDLQHSLELKEYLEAFQSGPILIGSSSKSDTYFPSLAEFSLLMDAHLRNNNMKERASITFLTPNDEKSFSKFASILAPILENAGITVHRNAEINTVDSKNKEVVLSDGQKLKYGLLVATPPLTGRGLLSESTLMDDLGFIKADPHTLSVGGNDNIYAIGDSQRVTMFRSAASAHRQALFVTSRIIADCVGGLSEKNYSDSTHGIQITTDGMAAPFDGSADGSITLGKESHGNYLIRMFSSDTYFTSILRGMM